MPVIGSSGKIVKIISQSDIIHYLALHMKSLDSKITAATVKDLKLGYKNVIGVDSMDYTWNAIRSMANHNLAAVPLVLDTRRNLSVDGSFTIIDTINEKDILYAASAFVRDDYNLANTGGLRTFFSMPVLDFVHAIRTSGRTRRTQHFFSCAVTIQPNER